jgi:hypothetical protein
MIIERIHASKINDKFDRTETTHYRISTTLNALISSRHTEAMARPPSGRPPKRPTKVGVQIAFRISNEMAEAIDREMERQRQRRPGAVIHRSDVAREILGRALLNHGAKRSRAA